MTLWICGSKWNYRCIPFFHHARNHSSAVLSKSSGLQSVSTFPGEDDGNRGYEHHATSCAEGRSHAASMRKRYHCFRQILSLINVGVDKPFLIACKLHFLVKDLCHQQHVRRLDICQWWHVDTRRIDQHHSFPLQGLEILAPHSSASPFIWLSLVKNKTS